MWKEAIIVLFGAVLRNLRTGTSIVIAVIWTQDLPITKSRFYKLDMHIQYDWSVLFWIN
jgi:hypothetical protein